VPLINTEKPILTLRDPRIAVSKGTDVPDGTEWTCLTAGFYLLELPKSPSPAVPNQEVPARGHARRQNPVDRGPDYRLWLQVDPPHRFVSSPITSLDLPGRTFSARRAALPDHRRSGHPRSRSDQDPSDPDRRSSFVQPYCPGRACPSGDDPDRFGPSRRQGNREARGSSARKLRLAAGARNMSRPRVFSGDICRPISGSDRSLLGWSRLLALNAKPEYSSVSL
jgi:hypothetical protein